MGVKEVLFILQNAVDRSQIQSSVESMFRPNFSFVEIAAKAILHCRRVGVRIVATTPHCHQNLDGASFSGDYAVALGNEADGLSRELLAGADSCVRIDMFGFVDSLNVAV